MSFRLWLFLCCHTVLFAQTAVLSGIVSAGPQAIPVAGAIATLRSKGTRANRHHLG